MSLVQACYPSDQLTDVAIYRGDGQVSGGGGQPVESNAVVVSRTKTLLTRLSGGQSERFFGRHSTSRWAVEFSSGENLQSGDLIAVLTGLYTGTIIEVMDVSFPLEELAVAQCDDTDRVLA